MHGRPNIKIYRYTLLVLCVNLVFVTYTFILFFHLFVRIIKNQVCLQCYKNAVTFNK